MNKNNIQKILKNALKNTTQSKLSKELCIPKSIISDWANGRIPSLTNSHHLKNLANYLGISFEHLLLGNQEQKQQLLTIVSFKDGNNKYSISITKIED